MAGFLGAVGRVVRYLVPLIGDALVLCVRCAVDAAAAARAGILWIARRRAPERGAEIEAKREELARARALRWAAWREVPWQRRLQVQATAVMLVALAFLAVWPHGRSYRWSPSGWKVAQRHAPSPSRSRAVYPTFAPPPTRTPVSPASIFERELAAAPAGAWVKTWDIPPVLPPGAPGAWDDFKVGSQAVLEEQGGYRLWYRGCHFSVGDYACGVGLATSKDGVSWERSASPVLVPADPYDREHLDRIAIARGREGYVLWYSVAADPAPEHRRAKLYAARSSDGLTWTVQPGAVYEAVAQPAHLRPSALWREDGFHVWLIDSRVSIDPATGLFPEMPPEGDDALLHFVSSDGTKLAARGSTPIAPLLLDWLTFSIGPDPSGGFRALFYEQSPSGRAEQGVNVLRSRDGDAWERAASEAMPLSVMDLGHFGPPGVSLSAVPAMGGLLAWFAVRTRDGGEAIRVAFRKER